MRWFRPDGGRRIGGSGFSLKTVPNRSMEGRALFLVTDPLTAALGLRRGDEEIECSCMVSRTMVMGESKDEDGGDRRRSSSGLAGRPALPTSMDGRYRGTLLLSHRGDTS